MAKSQQTASTNDAYAELSKPAFAVWSRLKELEPEALDSRRETAHEIGYSVRRSNEILSELAEKGYIRFEPSAKRFSPTKIVPLRPRAKDRPQENNRPRAGKRPLPKAPTGGRMPTAESNPSPKQPPTQNTSPLKAPGSQAPPAKINNNSVAVPPKIKRGPPRKRKVLFPAAENIEVKNSSGGAVSVGGSGGGSVQDSVLTEDSDQLKDSVLTPRYTARRAALTRAREIENQGNSSPGENKKASSAINLDKFRLVATASKAKRSERNKASRRQSRTAPPSGDDLGLEQDDELLGATFDPGPKQRARMVEVLARLPGDAERRKLARELGHHFRRIYTKYRRRYQPGYQFGPKQDRFAERAATLCVLHEVKPADLIAYWTEHVGDFTDMKYPSLSFLSSPGNVDKVACLRAPPGGAGSKREKPGKPCEVDSTHSYADTSRLNPRLRPGLLEAGFDLTGISDRYLMTVQGAAEAVGDFPKMYISGKMKPWVDWAAEHVYKEAVTEEAI